jgi:hypothetical protein
MSARTELLEEVELVRSLAIAHAVACYDLADASIDSPGRSEARRAMRATKANLHTALDRLTALVKESVA